MPSEPGSKPSVCAWWGQRRTWGCLGYGSVSVWDEMAPGQATKSKVRVQRCGVWKPGRSRACRVVKGDSAGKGGGRSIDEGDV